MNTCKYFDDKITVQQNVILSARIQFFILIHVYYKLLCSIIISLFYYFRDNSGPQYIPWVFPKPLDHLPGLFL